MASQSKCKSSKTLIERPGINWREHSLDGSSLILSAVKEAAMLAPISELKKAACSALLILKVTQIVKENKEAYERLGYDSGGLIIAIWCSFKKAEDPEEWLSAEMRDFLEDLSHTLENICSFVNDQLSKSKAMHVIFSRADGVKINEYREHLNYAMQIFELHSHMNINDVLIRVLKKNDQHSEEVLRRNEEEDETKHTLAIKALEARDREIAEKFQVQEWEISRLEQLKHLEFDREPEDERWHSNELKKIEKETNERKAELERLRAAARELKEASRLKEAEEAIARLKQALAAKEENRRSNGTRSSRQEDEVYKEEDGEWEGNLIVEGAFSEEFERLVRRSSRAKRNASSSPKRRLVAVDSTDEDEEDLQSFRSSSLRTSRRKLSSTSLPEEDFMYMRSANARMARRNLSSASLRVQETEDYYADMDEEDDYAPSTPRKSPNVRRKPQRAQTSSGTLSRDVDLIAHFQGFTPMGLGRPQRSRSGSNLGSGSPIYIPGMHSNPYFPTYGGSFSPPIGPYGYGIVMPGSVVNAGVDSEGASSAEEELERLLRSSKAKRNALGLAKRRLVPVEDSTDGDGEDLQSLRSSRVRSSRRKLSSASLPEEHFMSTRREKARMARRNLSSASLRVQETEDDHTDMDEEDDYAPSPLRKSPKVRRKPQTSSSTLPRDVDLMARFQGFTPMGLGSPHRSKSGSNSGSGSPIYIPGMHSNPYIPTYGGSFSPLIGPYGNGVGIPGTVVNAGVDSEGASSAEEELERLVRRSSKAKRNASGLPKRWLVEVEDSANEDGEDLQSLRSSRPRTLSRKLSSASLPEEHFMSMTSTNARMARRNLSSASLCVQETEDDYTDTDEDDYAPSPLRKSPKVRRKPQTSSGTLPCDVGDLMAQFQGFTPMGLGSSRHRSRSGSNSRLGSPIYILGVHSNPYFPTYGGYFSPLIGPYGHGFGMPGSVVNAGVGNIVNSTISNVGNVNRPRSRVGNMKIDIHIWQQGLTSLLYRLIANIFKRPDEPNTGNE